MVIELDPHESKVCTGNDNLDTEIGEGMGYEKFETEDFYENVIFFISLCWTLIAISLIVGKNNYVLFFK